MATIAWNIHFSSDPSHVYNYLSKASLREKYWAESASEKDGFVHFRFTNGLTYRSRILRQEASLIWAIDYFHAEAIFTLQEDKKGGTDLRMQHVDVPQKAFLEMHAGWVSLLLTFKAAVDFGVDLRNHDVTRTWDQNYADN